RPPWQGWRRPAPHRPAARAAPGDRAISLPLRRFCAPFAGTRGAAPTLAARDHKREVSTMRKLLIIGAAVAALSIASPAQADAAGAFVGGTAGAWTGGTIGFLLGGPIGAVIGGSTGAAIGASVLSDDVRFGRGG